MNTSLARFLISLAIVACASAQTFDFEPGEAPWTGDPGIPGQPVAAAAVKTGAIARMALGGDYWKGLSFPIGEHGGHLVATAAGNLGDAATGVLVSPEFQLTAANRCLSFLIGGSNDPAYERFELQVRYGGEYFTIFSATGRTEALRREVYSIPESAAGKTARFRIVDASASGHLNVDFIQLTASAPVEPHRTPVWGYADYHTHPMTYVAFGALLPDGQRPIWGNPGGAWQDYANRYRIACDLPHCIYGHGGGPLSELFLNMAQSVSAESFSRWTLRGILPHFRSGGPEFTDFPLFYRGAHEQMHISQIRRNYEGGLRLMVGLAVDNLGAEYLTARSQKGKVKTVPEEMSLETQICGMLRQAELNQDWMEIAYSAEQARDIILRNKLAVIMGVEWDQLLEMPTLRNKPPAEAVEYLWSLGIRAVTPIHAVDNSVGGPAIFEDPYNWLNDLAHRPPGKRDVLVTDLHRTPATWFKVEDATETARDHDGVLFRLAPKQQRVTLFRVPGSLFREAPFIWGETVDDYKPKPDDKNPPGHRNTVGLLDGGRQLIVAMMAKGMIVDLAHMSERSIDGVFRVRDEFRQQCSSARGSDCPTYPTIVSHAHYRRLGHYEAGAPNALRPSEYDISDGTLQQIRRDGGVLGTFTSQASIELPNDHAIDARSGIINDCVMSSKTFGISLHYAREKIGAGIGMATDFTFIAGVSPRFGPDACAGYKLQKELKYEKKHGHSKPGEQRNPIVYDGIAPMRGLRGANLPLKPYVAGDRTYNFNLDGLAHYGMVPDLLQDLKNVDPHATEALDSIFRSAEDYLVMWQRAEDLSQCNAKNAFCNPKPPAITRCRLPGALACSF